MAKIILITGGARSGKSSHALNLAESLSSKRLFVATCPKIDVEMAERVERHQQERKGRGWVTIECEKDLTDVFDQKSKGFDVVLVDCITLWVNNLLFSESAEEVIDDRTIALFCNEWLEAARKCTATVLCVTNEVGLGIVPDNALARRYRDLVGTCNQLIGRKANDVILVSCGIPLYLKKD